MSLATRCPSCGTVFRVVQDQLRVSEGWVRCGRCNGVFDAAEVLFDIDSGATVHLDLAPPEAAAAPVATPAAIPTAAPAERRISATPAPVRPPPPADAPAPWQGGRREPQFDIAAAADDLTLDGEPLLRAPSRDDVPPRPDRTRDPHLDPPTDERRHRQPDDALDEIVITDHVPPAPRSPPAAPAPADPPDPPAAASPPDDGSLPPAPTQAVPSFMRTAERSAVWRHPVARAAAALGVAGLALALLAQGALLWRDDLAARWPAATPALAALCQLAACSVQPLRRIEALSVHSSGLNRLEGSTLYRLQVVLHNRADTAVMMPALELSLTDAQGRLVVRRVLQAAELGAARPVLAAGEELPIKALMSTGEHRVDGYTLELFYP